MLRHRVSQTSADVALKYPLALIIVIITSTFVFENRPKWQTSLIELRIALDVGHIISVIDTKLILFHTDDQYHP